MKKVISLILCIALLVLGSSVAFAAEDKGTGFGAYKHVYIVGIDGSGAAWEMYDTPNFHRIFGDGAYRTDCITEYETISAQNWGSILTGVAYDVHGFTNENTDFAKRKSAPDNETIFRYVRNAMPDANLVSIVHWANINYGIIEDDLGIKKINRLSDPMVADAVGNYLLFHKAPALMFVHLDDVDHAGHTYGGQTAEYEKAVIKADEHLGIIYDNICKTGGMEDSLFILVADHGEANGGGHGGHSAEEEAVTVAVTGKNVNKMTLPEGTRNRDVAAIALYALGIDQPQYMTAKVPAGLFGEEHEINTDAPAATFEQVAMKFLYFFVRFANVVCSPFDFLVK